MVVALKRSPFGTSKFSTSDIEITDIENVVAIEQQNVRGGPTTLKSYKIDNEGGSAVIGWVKFFDVADTTWVAGTSLPALVVRYRATVNFLMNVTGSEEGFRFENGMSLWVNETIGDVNTTPPTDVVNFHANCEDG